MPAFATACGIVKKLQEAGFTAYFAGGWVRDYLMNHPSDDIDIATDADVEDIQKLFPKTIPVGINFGIIVVVENEDQFEVATFREELGYSDGRRPTGIEKSTPEKDAERRDFTINGMFYDPHTKTIYDYITGQEDIEKKLIRAIGDPNKRFLEDRLRMIRAVRYASRFHFTIHPDTIKAIKAHTHLLFPAVALERIWQEFCKMARFPNFDRALIMLHKLNLLPEIFPTLKNLSTDEIQSRLAVLEDFPENAPVIAQLLELFPNATLNEQLALCDHLKLSNQERKFITYYDEVKRAYHSQKPLEIYEWVKIYANPAYQLCFSLIVAHDPLNKRSDRIMQEILRVEKLKKPIERHQKQSPLISSSDLIEAGIKPGKTLGNLLSEAERIAVNEGINEKASILTRLKESSLWPK